MLRRDRERVRADLVGDVAVRGDAVRADDAEVDASRAHERRRRAVGEHGHGNARALSSHAVSRLPCSSGRVSSANTSTRLPALARDVDRRERGADAGGRERAGVAVREHARAVGNERRAVLADAPAHRAILVENPRRLGAQRVERSRAASSTSLRSHAACGRSPTGDSPRWDASRESSRRGSSTCARDRRRRRRRERCERYDQAHRAGDADRRRAAHGQRADRVAHLIQRAKIALDERLGQPTLVDDRAVNLQSIS